MAYGQNPDTAVTGNPALDVGYTVLPSTEEWFDLVMTVDKKRRSAGSQRTRRVSNPPSRLWYRATRLA
ncbi:MAG: hypothetical protein R3F37_22265 [Candidatus Competibacteraceae bacterium]